MDNVSLWIPLDPIPEAMALRFIPGSHRWGARYIPRRFADQREYVEAAAGFTHLPPVAELDARASVTCPAEPGDLVAFHFRALHAAPGTVGHGGRRAVSMRYVGDDARWATRPWRTSPPLEADGLRVGDPLDDPRFPVVATAP
jgi:ectoine hydroxylase-related dioxygenase (phytanoyl-CoA dioxygenase family)